MKNGPYELVIAPPEYPGFKYRGRYVYEHHLVWWQNTGEVFNIDGDFVVHHKNENKRDNAYSNLEKKERGPHTREHILETRAAPLITIRCAWCGSKVVKLLRTVKRAKRNGQINFFCNHSHGALHQFNAGSCPATSAVS